jgi:hypothetical protein
MVSVIAASGRQGQQHFYRMLQPSQLFDYLLLLLPPPAAVMSVVCCRLFI